ncbi:MAG: malonyl CoA-acyl carrier protein transacylase, partial [Bacteroidota bacterium]
MSKTAYLFPGQGSQSVGMGKDHFDTNSTFKALLSRANDILGYDLTAVMFDGPEETLRQTEHT